MTWSAFEQSSGAQVDFLDDAPQPVTHLTDHTGYEPLPILGKHRAKHSGRPLKPKAEKPPRTLRLTAGKRRGRPPREV